MKNILFGLTLSIAVSANAMEIEESVDTATGDVSAKITEPKFPGTDFPVNFNEWKKEDGVCKLFGYEKAVPRSTVNSETSERVIMLNGNGAIERMRSDYPRTTEIVCAKKILLSPLSFKLVTVNEPRHLESAYPVNFDDWKKEDGVCKLFGFERAVPHSAINSQTSERVILLNGNGEIERMRKDYPRIKKIVCFSKP